MTDSNQVRLTGVEEVTIGTTPNTPRMRAMLMTSESLDYSPIVTDSEAILASRQRGDQIKVGEDSKGGINIQLQYPPAGSLISSIWQSLFFAAWVQTPERDNDGTADSVITGVTASSDTYTVATGAAFVEGHLVRATGFTNSGNNQIFRAQSGSGATAVVAPSSPGLVDEAAPAAAAALKVVGFQGASGDITATANGLGSTALDFTTLGLVPGMFLKIGGSASGDKFATAALNTWVRVSGTPTATALPLDHLPSGWTTDSGTGKTIKVWFGDMLKDGVTKKAVSFEKGFMAQQTPTFIAYAGMIAQSGGIRFEAEQKVMANFDFLGMTASQGTSSLDASPDAAPTEASYPVIAAGANVNRVTEAGSVLTSPNYCRGLEIQINNNLRKQSAVDSMPMVGHGVGYADVTIKLNTYFGSNALYAKVLAGTPTSASSVMLADSRALVFHVPRMKAQRGNPAAGGPNQDVMLPVDLKASADTTTGAQIIFNRLPYYE